MEFINNLKKGEAQTLWDPLFLLYTSGSNSKDEKFDFNFKINADSFHTMAQNRTRFNYMNHLQISIEIAFQNYIWEQKKFMNLTPKIWDFINICSPSLFLAVVKKMKEKNEKLNDLDRIKKSVLYEYFSSRINKQIDIIRTGAADYDEMYSSKLERLTKSSLFVWRFDLPRNDIGNELVRFRIAKNKIIEFNAATFPLQIKMPTQILMQKTYKKFIVQSLANVNIANDICKIITGYCRIY